MEDLTYKYKSILEQLEQTKKDNEKFKQKNQNLKRISLNENLNKNLNSEETEDVREKMIDIVKEVFFYLISA